VVRGYAFDPRPQVSGAEPGALVAVDLQPSYLLAVPVQQGEVGPEESSGAGCEGAGEGLPETYPGFQIGSIRLGLMVTSPYARGAVEFPGG
jgi:hypothetical protein